MSEKITPLRISINCDYIIDELQRSMALEDSGAKEPVSTGKRHINCDGYGCKPTCDYEATRYYNSGKGQTESEDRKSERHNYYRRSMRL
mgnify:CR=1 FL=1